MPSTGDRAAYIAGPMTGIVEWNFAAFDEARDALRRDGWNVISPADLDRADGFRPDGMAGTEELSQQQKRRFARNDIGALLVVDAVFVLPGWERSAGATHEVQIAGWLGLPIYTWPEGREVAPPDDWSGRAAARLP